MHENTRATEEEQEQGPQRLQDEEEMRGTSPGEPERPVEHEDKDEDE